MKVAFQIVKKTYEKKDYSFCNYYLVLDNGRYLQIKPTSNKDYSLLKAVAVPLGE